MPHSHYQHQKGEQQSEPRRPGICRNPPKLTVFLQRARHGEVTSRDPAFWEVRPPGAGPLGPHGSAPSAQAGGTPLFSGPRPRSETVGVVADSLRGRLLAGSQDRTRRAGTAQAIFAQSV